MNRCETLALLTTCGHKPEMQRRFGVRSLALFGSRAREQSHVKWSRDAERIGGYRTLISV